MKIKVCKSILNGELAVPGSKSHTIRAIAAALMAEGTSIVRAPLDSADTRSTLNAAKLLGAKVDEHLEKILTELVISAEALAAAALAQRENE